MKMLCEKEGGWVGKVSENLAAPQETVDEMLCGVENEMRTKQNENKMKRNTKSEGKKKRC